MQDTKAILESELEEIESQIVGLQKVFEERPGYGLGKGSSLVARREVNRAMLRRLRRRADELERALLRLTEGSYGICVRCGKPIHPERLAVLPDTQLCIECRREDE